MPENVGVGKAPFLWQLRVERGTGLMDVRGRSRHLATKPLGP